MKHILDILHEIQNSNMSQQVKSNLLQTKYTLSLKEIQELLNLSQRDVGSQQQPPRQDMLQYPQQQWKGWPLQPQTHNKYPGVICEQQVREDILDRLAFNRGRRKNWEILYNSVCSSQGALDSIILKVEQMTRVLCCPLNQAVTDTLDFQAATIGLALGLYDLNNPAIQNEMERIKSLGSQLDSTSPPLSPWSSLVVDINNLRTPPSVDPGNPEHEFTKMEEAERLVDGWLDFTTPAMRLNLIDFLVSLDEVSVERFMRITADEALAFGGIGPSSWEVIQDAQMKMRE